MHKILASKLVLKVIEFLQKAFINSSGIPKKLRQFERNSFIDSNLSSNENRKDSSNVRVFKSGCKSVSFVSTQRVRELWSVKLSTECCSKLVTWFNRQSAKLTPFICSWNSDSWCQRANFLLSEEVWHSIV